MDLEFNIPDSKTPGYLKRAKEALEFQKQMQDGMTPEGIVNLVEYLAQYVSVPEEPAAKREALWMATEEQFTTLLKAVTGDVDEPSNPTTPAPAT